MANKKTTILIEQELNNVGSAISQEVVFIPDKKSRYKMVDRFISLYLLFLGVCIILSVIAIALATFKNLIGLSYVTVIKIYYPLFSVFILFLLVVNVILILSTFVLQHDSIYTISLYLWWIMTLIVFVFAILAVHYTRKAILIETQDEYENDEDKE
ncbi:hypothetical protein [Mycoplasma amphoriforme]|uniref:Uncharacterized protein n=1 Tax=Mycoplasma amphoriforme A39 TaxID=572419 RepID=A0A292IHY3_9MOLU|nr:unnamed protein product [Mycoplasma amphoriforme A39]